MWLREDATRSRPVEDAPDESASETGLDSKYSDGHEVGPGELAFFNQFAF